MLCFHSYFPKKCEKSIAFEKKNFIAKLIDALTETHYLFLAIFSWTIDMAIKIYRNRIYSHFVKKFIINLYENV